MLASLLPLLKFQMIAGIFKGGKFSINKLINMVMQLQMFQMLPKLVGGVL